jgi:ATP-dependent Clp protease protease subunit
MSTDTESKEVTLKDRGIYFLSKGFDEDSAKDVVTWILESNYQKDPLYDHLTLIINSPGGDVNAAFAIIDIMRGSPLPVHTLGLGAIQSCGLLAFMAGAKRIATPNTSILSHQYAWGDYGKHHELLATTTEVENINKRILDHYRRCTGLTAKRIIKELLPPSDVWLTAEQAKKYKLVDEIRLTI